MVLNIWVTYMKKNVNRLEKFVMALLLIIVTIVGVIFNSEGKNKSDNIIDNNEVFYDISNIPQYNGNIYIKINDNIPRFSTEDMKIVEDYYSNLEKGRVRSMYDKN